MSTAENFAELRASVEEQYLQDFTAEQPTDIYFELASIIAARTVHLDRTVLHGLDAGLLNKAEQEARASVRYSLGYRACAADFSQGNEVELEKLMKQVKRLI